MTVSLKKSGPVRTCLGCSAKKAKRDLVRLIVDGNQVVQWDRKQTRPGRGAYICPSSECLARALKSGRFRSAFGLSAITAHLKDSVPPWGGSGL